MKATNSYLTLAGLLLLTSAQAQSVAEPKPDKWTAYNRNVDFNTDVIHMDAKENDGVLWLNGFTFNNGTIELDIKGKDVQGQSFVGVAFHGKDDMTFDGIYFRPFNFQSPERKTHSVQYISMPDNNWQVLRTKFPEKYEKTVTPVPDPNDWFHAKIVVNYPKVTVYVNNSATPSLEVEQLTTTKQGKFGLWVGNGSEGWFRKVMVSPAK